MTKYLTAAKLGILPEERKALVAFVTKAAEGQIVALNGRKHYYDQRDVEMSFDYEEHTCGTEGCIAGYVFAHAKYIQKKRTLRAARSASDYINASWKEDYLKNIPDVPFLYNLYREGDRRTLNKARGVVRRALTTGKVSWR